MRTGPVAEAARLESEGHALIGRGHELLARAAQLRAETPGVNQGGDELVALADCGLDARSRRRLEREGRLPVSKIGRRKFTTRSALVALVPSMSTIRATPEARTPAETPGEAARKAYAALATRPAAARRVG
jgi:hypothetical protein